jgi:hypothetical protein
MDTVNNPLSRFCRAKADGRRPLVLPGSFTVARVLTGCFLLVTAGLKIHGLTRVAVFDASFLFSPQVQVAALTVELILGAWLLSGRYQRDAWLAALVLFTTFSGISLYLTAAGQRSCPSCFGAIRVNPAVTLTLDLAIVVVLAGCRPVRGERIPRRAMLGTAAVVACVLGGALLLDQSILAHLRGEFISVDPAVSDVGDGEAGDEQSFAVRLTNHANKAVQIKGGKKNCGCVPTDDLPVTLGPSESRSINVRMSFGGSPGRFMRRVILYTDDDAQPIVSPRVTGRVIAPK